MRGEMNLVAEDIHHEGALREDAVIPLLLRLT